MSEIRTSGPLLFTEPNNPTRVGEIINTLNEIYDIPMPRLGMSVYVKDEGVNYTITKLEPKLIEGVLVPDAKVAGYELQTGKSIAWNSSSNVNDYVVAGVYNITGERLNVNDGLPIANSNPGHTISARLVVLDSSITGTGDSQDKCITQVLTLSNRTGEDGNMYIRTGYGGNINSLSWKPWATLQTNTNVGQVDNLDNLKDNGIYSGVWTKGSYNAYPLTFVCIVINDYFVGTAPRRISQFVYGLSKFDGSTVYQSRVWDDSKNAWGDWEILNQKEIAKIISNEIKKVTDGVDPEKLDSLKDLIAWVDTHGGEVAGIKSDIQANEAAIANETNRAQDAERALGEALQDGLNQETTARNNLAKDIRAKAMQYNTLGVNVYADKAEIYGRSIDTTPRVVEFPAATTERAGVMSAEDKKTIDSLDTTIAEGEKRALRRLFVAAGAEYNDSGADKTKTAPWGETVTHKAGHYYLNGLGDITEEQMMAIYNAPHNALYEQGYIQQSKIRTAIFRGGTSSFGLTSKLDALFMDCSNLEVVGNRDFFFYFKESSTPVRSMFKNCVKLRVINVRIFYVNNITLDKNCFGNCQSLEYVNIERLHFSLSLADCIKISKNSIVYMIQKATPTSAITITLHPEAYARLADDADIVAALEAQPLVTLVSA